jgi:HAD superfamily hydrolase (TIGR01509 family)
VEHPGSETRASTAHKTPKQNQAEIMIPSQADRWIQAKPESIRGLIFDCDGLLVGTEALFTQVESDIFRQYGFAFGLEQKAILTGNTIPVVGEIMASTFNLPGKADSFAEKLTEGVLALMEEGLTPLPGVSRFLEICSRAVPLAAASNSPRVLLDHVLQIAGIESWFAITVAFDEVARPKPAADIYFAALEQLGIGPTEAVAFEDSATGAKAAKAAGLALIGVPEAGAGRIGADWHVTSLEDPTVVQWASLLTMADGLVND